jgi:hypothetical protein
LGQHRIWKRMAVSWSGQVYIIFCSIRIKGFINYYFSFQIVGSYLFFVPFIWDSIYFLMLELWVSELKWETVCWICVVEVGI